MFDRDIFKALIGEIADTREVEIGCDECFEQLDRFVEMKLSGLNAAHSSRNMWRFAVSAARNSRRCWRPYGRPEKGDPRMTVHQPSQAFSRAYAMASSKPSRLPSAHAASHLASDNRGRVAAK
jgi:hypothetical protein